MTPANRELCSNEKCAGGMSPPFFWSFFPVLLWKLFHSLLDTLVGLAQAQCPAVGGVSCVEVNIGAATLYVKHGCRKTILNVLKISLGCGIQLGRSLQEIAPKNNLLTMMFPSLFFYESDSNLYWEKDKISCKLTSRRLQSEALCSICPSSF